MSPVEWIPSGGRALRHLAVGPTGRWLLAANQDSDAIRRFWIDPKTASGYVIAQLRGAILGSVRLLLWGEMGRSVAFGATLPNPLHPLRTVVLGELVTRFCLITSLCLVIGIRALRRFTPAILPRRREFEETLPDLTDADIGGSGFALRDYRAHRALGGDAALPRLRGRLRQRGLRPMLDFVPNHVAPDHPWVDAHPELFVHGREDDLVCAPQNWCCSETRNGPRVLASGRPGMATDPGIPSSPIAGAGRAGSVCWWR